MTARILKTQGLISYTGAGKVNKDKGINGEKIEKIIVTKMCPLSVGFFLIVFTA